MSEINSKENIILRPATMGDAKLLFDWRNDPETRMQSIDTGEVFWDKHLEWLKKSLSNQNRKIIIAKIKGQPVGTIRLDIGKPRSELSWTVAPSARGKGVGTKMVLKAIQFFSCPLLAKIKPGNLASMKIAEKAGFQKQSSGTEITEWHYDS